VYTDSIIAYSRAIVGCSFAVQAASRCVWRPRGTEGYKYGKGRLQNTTSTPIILVLVWRKSIHFWRR